MNTAVLCLVLGLILGASALVPLRYTDSRTKIDGQYILIFKDEVTDDIADLHLKNLTQLWNPDTNSVIHRYKIGNFRAFGAKLDERMLTAELNSPHLDSVEVDQKVQMYPYSKCTCDSITHDSLWGLAQISSRHEATDVLRTPEELGLGVHVYVLDTGLKTDHVQFAGRVGNGWSVINNNDKVTDGNGHGTHVAGTVAGNSVGAAALSTIHAVQVLSASGSGSNTGVIAGINWVVDNVKSKSTVPAIANMSLGGGHSAAVNAAVNNAVTAGVPFVVAAGNSNADACNYSPASAESAITVGALDKTLLKATYSNCGPCVDVMAPGTGVYSAWYTGGYATLSGTSMAAPHVAALATLHLSVHPLDTPAELKQHIIDVATDLTGFDGGFKIANCPERMAYIDCSECPKIDF